MAKGINKVILVGNLGQDPEVRYSQAGAAITNISIATTDSWTDKQSGQRQDRTEWHRVVFFNRLAEVAGEYLRKGSQVYIEGALRTRKWQDQQGQDKYTTEIVASEMQMLGSRGDSAGGAPMGGGMGGGYNQQPAQPNYGASQQSQQQPQQQGGYGQPAPQNAPQQQSYSQNSAPQAPPAQPQSAPPQPAPAPKPSMDSFDDDIPF